MADVWQLVNDVFLSKSSQAVNELCSKIKRGLIDEYHLDETDLNNKLAKRLKERGDSNGTYYEFFYERLDLAEKHYKGTEAIKDEESYMLTRNIYLMMFELLNKLDKKITPVSRKMNKLEIEKASLGNFEKEIVIIATGCCDYCLQFNDVHISVEDALEKFPLDYDKCTRERGCFCQCCHVNKRNSEGRLIRRRTI